MKVELSVSENTEKDDLETLQARDCKTDPSIDSVVECEPRVINDRKWTWTALRASKDFDQAYVVVIRTIVGDQVYSLIARIFRGEDASQDRIDVLHKILESAKVNE